MLNRFYIISCISVVLLYPIGSHAELKIDARIEQQFDGILKNPMNVYSLDHKAYKVQLKHIETWFSKHIDVSAGTIKKGKEDEGLIISVPAKKAKPLFLFGDQKKVIPVAGSRYAWIKKTPKSFTFRKEYDIPSKRSMNRARATDIATEFILKNMFVVNTSYDQLSSPLVLARKRQQYLKDKKQGNAVILSQVIIFSRKLFGQEVINARQVVEVHPETGELLGYKQVRWIPVDEQSGNAVPYITYKELVSKLHTIFKDTEQSYHVVKVKNGFYQSGENLIPVVAVTTEPVLSDPEIVPLQHTKIISLAKGLEFPKRTDKIRAPSRPSR